MHGPTCTKVHILLRNYDVNFFSIVALYPSSPSLALVSPRLQVALVYGQMNEPPGARARVALTALTVAEYFRDKEGKDVLLFIDNIFRFTQAGSEVRGYHSMCGWALIRIIQLVFNLLRLPSLAHAVVPFLPPLSPGVGSAGSYPLSRGLPADTGY